MAYPMEYRRAVAAAYDQCGSSREVAEEFHCSEAWVRRLIQRRRERGTLEPLPLQRPDNRKLKDPELTQLAQLIAQRPDMTLGELAAALENKVSVPTVHRATKKLKLPLKKNPSTRPNKTDRTSSKDAPRGSRSSKT